MKQSSQDLTTPFQSSEVVNNYELYSKFSSVQVLSTITLRNFTSGREGISCYNCISNFGTAQVERTLLALDGN